MRPNSAKRNKKAKKAREQHHAAAGNRLEESRIEVEESIARSLIHEETARNTSTSSDNPPNTERVGEPPLPVGPRGANPGSPATADDSIIFSTPVVPSSASRSQQQERSNILAPLRLNLERENRPSSSRESLETEVQNIKDLLAQQIAFNQELKEMLSNKERETEEEQRTRGKRKRLPKTLTANVREVYKSITEDEEDGTPPKTWDLTKCYDDDENKAINSEIFRSVKSVDNETSSTTIKAAMRVHFRTKKREFQRKQAKTEDGIKRSQRRRSRLNSKRKLRQRVLQESSSISQEEKDKLQQAMTVDYMSSEQTASAEEEGEEENSDEEVSSSHKGFILHPLPWRSAELNRVFDTLDKKVHRRRGQRSRNMLFERKKGANSSRLVPDDAPAWAVRNTAVN